MKSKILFILSFVFMLSSVKVFSQTEKLHAMYIFNFLPEIEWPKESRGPNVTIAVLGSNEAVVGELQKTTNGKKVGNRPIVITYFNSVNDISNCDILFVPPKQTAKLGKAIEKAGSQNTLVISSAPNGIELGAAINFVVLNNKLNFEVKPSNAQKNKVKISSSLIQLASKVHR
jgi:hypothetical protein